jgi:hypothetical protein
MSITNLLARGFDPMPAGGQANALMQVQQLRAGQQRNALMQQQMQQSQMEMAQAQRNALLSQQWREGLQVPQGTAAQVPGMPAMNAAQAESAVGTPGYGVSSAQDRTEFVPPDPRQVAAVKMAKANMMSPMDLFKIQNPETETASAAAGSVVYDKRTGKQIMQVPDKAEKDPENVRLLRMIHGDGTPAFQAALAALGTKMVTHAPAAQAISYGSPVPFVGADGSIQYAQPGNRPGAAPQIMAGPDGKPLVKPTDSGKLPAELQRMQIAGDTMSKLMDDYEKLLKANNPRDPMVQANPTLRADIQSLKRNIELQFKELQALGALAGPDVEIIRQALSDPFSVAGAYYGKDGLLAQVKRSRDLVRMRSESVLASQGQGGKPPAAGGANAAANADPLGLRGGK